MKRSDFFDLIARFAQHPIPATINRHVYLWMGDVDSLLSNCPAGFIKKLDLHALCSSLTRTPLGDKAAGRELSDAIDEWILKEFPVSQRQRALLITGLDLLYRYRLPLSIFVRLANESTMIVLGLSALDINARPARSLPAYIQFSPHSILRHVAAEIPEEALVKEE